MADCRMKNFAVKTEDIMYQVFLFYLYIVLNILIIVRTHINR